MSRRLPSIWNKTRVVARRIQAAGGVPSKENLTELAALLSATIPQTAEEEGARDLARSLSRANELRFSQYVSRGDTRSAWVTAWLSPVAVVTALGLDQLVFLQMNATEFTAVPHRQTLRRVPPAIHVISDLESSPADV